MRLTNSEMSTWRRCRRKWYLSQYLGLRPKHQAHAGTPLSVGSRVHDALAAYYASGERRGDPVQQLRDGVAVDVERYPSESDQLAKDLDLCEAMLMGYLEWLEETGADEDLVVIAPETKLEVELQPGSGVFLLSKLDARVQRRSTGARLAAEYKTVGDLTSPLPGLQLDSQLLTEHLVEFLKLRELGEEGQCADGVLYRMLRKVKRTSRAKPPFYGEEEVHHSVDELRNHWRHVWAVAQEVRRARDELDAGADHHHVVYPNPTRDCRWDCPFIATCKLMNADGDWRGHVAENFTEGDPLERYWGTQEVDV